MSVVRRHMGRSTDVVGFEAAAARICVGVLSGVVLSGFLGAATSGEAGAACVEGYGDADGSAAVDAADVQCLILASLNELAGSDLGSVECLTQMLAADTSCDGQLDLVDLQIAIALSLGAPLSAELDADGTSCPDACELVCGDGTCSDNLGEGCLTCPLDCGECEDNCCETHDTPGCVQDAVEACVCGISDFCCEFFWDQSCVDTAKEFCNPTCQAPSCAVSGTIGCGDTLFGTTATSGNTVTGATCGGVDGSGKDKVYVFSASAFSGIEVNLEAAVGAALNVYILAGECDSGSCTAGGAAMAASQVQPDALYYVVVDGPAGSEGQFSLSLTCADDCDVDALCAGSECGAVICAGFTFSCGSCGPTQTCQDNTCVEIPPFPGCPGPGSCTTINPTTGCSDAACCSIVCAMDDFCCSNSWDDICVGEALEFCFNPCGDGACDPAAGENCGTCAADCGCTGGLGCFQNQCIQCTQANVCGSDVCGSKQCGTQSISCGSCPDGQSCSAGACVDFVPYPGCPGSGSCFSPNGSIGCDDAVCCSAVCPIDPFCCNNTWDSICAQEATELCTGGGGGTNPGCPGGGGSCLSAKTTPGCSDVACCSIVCAEDAFCCDSSWDEICVDEAISLCP